VKDSIRSAAADTRNWTESTLEFTNLFGAGVDAILAADFLSADQKGEILCNNAARFLRLDNSVCLP
jgi:hypothetical protein